MSFLRTWSYYIDIWLFDRESYIFFFLLFGNFNRNFQVQLTTKLHNEKTTTVCIENQPRKVLVRRRPLVRNTFDPNTCWHLWSLLVLHPEKRQMFIMGLHMCRYFNAILRKSSWVAAGVISEFGKNFKNSHYK